MLITIDNVLSKDDVRQFRGYLDRAEWRAGVDSAGALARKAKFNQQLDDQAEVATRLGQHVLRSLASHALFISAALPRKIYPPKFNRYQQGGQYGTHVDSALLQLPGTGMFLRSDLSATLFLAEPDEYDGGVLEIEGELGAQSVKLAAGDLVLYPSSSLHRVTPVTRGVRLAAFFWVESVVGDDAERSLLFDLDQTIQQLSATLDAADPASLLKLTGIYHNLLRRWAIT